MCQGAQQRRCADCVGGDLKHYTLSGVAVSQQSTAVLREMPFFRENILIVEPELQYSICYKKKKKKKKKRNKSTSILLLAVEELHP